MPKPPELVLLFHPEQLGEVERFSTFYTGTYSFDPRDVRALRGVTGHFLKARRLRHLAERLVPNLNIDEAQLEEHGSTPADNASELATVLEASIVEIYSSLDCTVKTLFAIYNPGASSRKKSTRRFFLNYDPDSTKMPPEIATTLADVGWYRRLLHLRDELTHLDTGAVHRDSETRLIRYIHHGLTEQANALVIDDIFEWIDTTLVDVDAWLGQVFHFLNSTLSNAEVTVPCAVVEGRFMMRMVSGKPPVTFHSGRCISAQWFDIPGNPRCPFASECGAYQRRATFPPPEAVS
ncbi:hypothetical protein ASD21_07165 [Caulobacter sp. Root1455]|uniref:hypothetical protein n=1 Tax=Caulobacter sp. Root1455 TaxID=1736465 RepID=UPI0006F8B924|nr:hypothetical protein [Caulobacter sp. Root1455]KQY95138.1 hypothetical protein ASD21_07165 [Caulobacter sp. Root1455]